MPDTNYRSYYGEDGTRLHGESLPDSMADPLAYDDTLKFSACRNFQVGHCFIRGGREDCIDMVRGEGATVFETDLEPKGRNGITIKGGIKFWRLEGLHFTAHGSECDIDLGQFSIHDRFPFRKDRVTSGVIVESDASGDTPIVVRCWNADAPTVLHSRVTIRRVPWIVWFPYFTMRRLQVIFTGK